MAHFCSNTSLPRVTDPAAGWPVDFFVPLLAGGSCAATAVAMARPVVPTITKFRLTISLLRLLQRALPANADFDLVPNGIHFPFLFGEFPLALGPRYRRGRKHPGTKDRFLPGNLPDFRTFDPCETYESRSEEHTSELQSRGHIVCRLLLEKKKKLL